MTTKHHPAVAVDRLSPVNVALLALIGLSICGAIAIGMATMEVDSTDPLIWAPVFYLIASLSGFALLPLVIGVCGRAFAGRPDPARAWADTALVLLAALVVLVVIGGFIAGPGLALGITANFLAAALGMVWSAPITPRRSWPHALLLCATLVAALAGTGWLLLLVPAS